LTRPYAAGIQAAADAPLQAATSLPLLLLALLLLAPPQRRHPLPALLLPAALLPAAPHDTSAGTPWPALLLLHS
jgi:hypothetical protein